MKKAVFDVVLKDYAVTQAKGYVKGIFKKLLDNEDIVNYQIVEIDKYHNKKKKKRKGYKLQYKAVVKIIFKEDLTESVFDEKVQETLRIIEEDTKIISVELLSSKSHSHQLIKNGKIPYSIKYHTLPGEDEDLKKLIELKPELLTEYERWGDILRYTVKEKIHDLLINQKEEIITEKTSAWLQDNQILTGTITLNDNGSRIILSLDNEILTSDQLKDFEKTFNLILRDTIKHTFIRDDNTESFGSIDYIFKNRTGGKQLW